MQEPNSSLQSIYHQLAALGREYGAEQIKLYGSRARGDHRERSDIDIAVYGLPQEKLGAFWSAVEDLPTMLDFDIVFVSPDTDADLMKNIEKDGVPLMNKMEEKYSKLILAVSRLKESIEEYDKTHSDSVRDGAIQRFEFCTELAWKTAREYLIDQGYDVGSSPKAVMKQAYADGLISDGDLWVELITDRNLTSHLYDEKTATAIFGKIASVYLPLFQSLIDAFAKG